MKKCFTCRWVACPNYGKEKNPCSNYIPSLEEERRENIENFVKNDCITKDNKYNDGLLAIKKFGYASVSANDEVKYYCMCNNL